MISNNIKALMFLEGIVSISLQFLVLRQLMPYAGSSIITTSIVISIFLAALAYGYKKGGSYRGDKIEKFQKNMIISGLLLGTCVSSSFVGLFFLLVETFFVNSSIFVAVILYSFFVMAPIVYFMAQTVPLLVDLIKKDNTNEKVGNSISINTMGNILGGIITTLILMYFLGISWSIIINSTILIILYVITKFKFTTLIKGLGALSLISLINGFGNTIEYDISTQYADYVIVESELYDKEVKVFISNRSASSLIFKDGTNAKYIEDIREKLKDKKEILVLGAGGFTISENKKEEQNFTYVDVDSQIKKIVEEHYLNKKITEEFVAADARAFVAKTKNKWDAVVIDVYSNRTSVPSHLLTVEFYNSIKKILNKDGVVLINTILSTNMKDDFSQGINNTINYSLGPCFSNKMKNDTETANVVYECFPIKERVIYSDQKNKHSFDQGVSRN